ncbi:MAG: pyridoxal phosphate-dependent class II aminotransferase [Treponema sp.]|jgi:threonine-phosphate decarboxylase|nr:pyridoxal phosphate-dependent class II aminotransferase [Treponema sp.]
MNKYDHGGNIYGVKTDLPGKPGALPLDFSANTSPLGVPPGVLEAVRREAPGFGIYPDPLCGELREALGRHCRCDPARIVCGNGAADLIYRIVKYARPRRALIAAPSFSEYERALEAEGAEIIFYPLAGPRFGGDAGILSSISAGTDMLFLCNPNNPTGALWDRPLMESVIDKCADTGTVAVIDECFNGFLDDPAGNSVQGFLDRVPGLVVLNAFTKVYGMAGFRLGYMICGSEEICRGVAGTGQPWSVSSVAQTAGIAALEDSSYIEEMRCLVKAERTFMKNALAGLGLEVLGGEANYIFFRLGGDFDFARPGFSESLLSRGFLLRCCANYPGLDDSYYRICLRKHAENESLVKALRALREGG